MKKMVYLFDLISVLKYANILKIFSFTLYMWFITSFYSPLVLFVLKDRIWKLIMQNAYIISNYGIFIF